MDSKEFQTIATFEQAIEAIIRTGIADNLEFDDIGHPGILGDMYEGLTREAMQAALLKGLNLYVRKGKIRYAHDQYSNQIDCMIVVGEGVRVGHSDHYVYNLNDVIAVVEVKKTLTRTRLEGALSLFAEIAKMRMTEPFDEQMETAILKMRRDGFRAVFGRPRPKDEASLLPVPYSKVDNLMYAAIRSTSELPLFVIWGYSGYTTEHGFRMGLKETVVGGSEINWEKLLARPDCVIAGDLTYVKATGMPFAVNSPVARGHVYAYTQNGLGIRSLLNMIWYRICKRFKRDFMLLGDGRIFAVNPFALLVEQNSMLGVAYCDVPARSLTTRELQPPVPIEFTIEEYFVISSMDSDGVLDISNFESVVHSMSESIPVLLELCSQVGLTRPQRLEWRSYPELLRGVTRSGLLVREDNMLRLAATRMIVQISAEGIIAFDNRDGAFNALLPEGFLRYLRTTSDHQFDERAFFFRFGAQRDTPATFVRMPVN